MHRYFITLTLSTIGLFQTRLLACNSYGYMSVAYIAYQKLTPQVRDKATALLTKKYQNAAKALAKKEVALAGARLANLLNSELK